MSKLSNEESRCLGAHFSGRRNTLCPLRERCARFVQRYKGDRYTPCIEGGAEDEAGGCLYRIIDATPVEVQPFTTHRR